jgi:predicted hydrocarbon binding protein
MEEVLGEKRLDSVLKNSDSLILEQHPDAPSLVSFRDAGQVAAGDRTFSFTSLSRLLEAVEQAYGPQAGRGMSLQVGRACVQYGLREFGATLGLTTTAFRLLPLPQKLSTAARALADLFNSHTDQRVKLERQPGSLLWHIERCPLCWERHTKEPICQLAVGLVQEGLYWLSGGKIFNVEEIACVARGDPTCTLRIDEAPLT